jgi:hypothetical protein
VFWQRWLDTKPANAANRANVADLVQMALEHIAYTWGRYDELGLARHRLNLLAQVIPNPQEML